MNTKIKWQTSNNFVCQNHFNLDLYTYNIMAAPIITVFKNGDVYFPGKKLVINPKEIRNFDALLDKITSVTKAKVAVRSIRTPSHGHRVNSVTRLENGGVYVAVGCERFKKLEYVFCCVLGFCHSFISYKEKVAICVWRKKWKCYWNSNGNELYSINC